MGEPTIFLCPMPVLYVCRDCNNSSGCKADCLFPSSWYQPSPAVQTKSWPPPLSAWWICQLFQHPGSKLTFARNTGHFPGSVSGFRQELPIKYCEKASFGAPIPKLSCFSNSILSATLFIICIFHSIQLFIQFHNPDFVQNAPMIEVWRKNCPFRPVLRNP